MSASGRLSQGATPLLSNEEPKKESASESKEVYQIVFFCILSVLSSVFIAICMKKVMEGGFPFPLTVSWVAYVFTWIFYQVIKATGAWSPEKDADGEEKSMPAMENIKVSVASIGSISFMNLCLKVNTVAIYQICKFATIPTTITLQYFIWAKKTNWRILLSVSLLLSGVSYASMKSFDAGKMGPVGVIFAVIAVGSTSVYRIFQDTKQQEWKIGPETFQSSMSGWQAVLGLVACLIVEGTPIENDAEHTNIAWIRNPTKFSPQLHVTLLWMFGVCVAALTVNYTSMVLIGKTGPVAYAVVGNAKTILTIMMGIIMFPKDENAASIRGDVIGCSIGLVGAVFYAYFEFCFKKGKPDFVESMMPSLVKVKVSDWQAQRAAEKAKAVEAGTNAK